MARGPPNKEGQMEAFPLALPAALEGARSPAHHPAVLPHRSRGAPFGLSEGGTRDENWSLLEAFIELEARPCPRPPEKAGYLAY